MTEPAAKPAGPQKRPQNQDELQSVGAIEHVRLRKEMYIGLDLDIGLIYLADVVAEALLAKGGKHIEITLHADNFITVADDGPGLPTEPVSSSMEAAPEPAVQSMLTQAVVGFGTGLNMIVANALSTQLELKICRDGSLWEQSYRQGYRQNDLHKAGTTDKHGSSVRFQPDPEIFGSHQYDFDKLMEWFCVLASKLEQDLSARDFDSFYGKYRREQAALFRNARFTIIDERAATGPRRVSFGPS